MKHEVGRFVHIIDAAKLLSIIAGTSQTVDFLWRFFFCVFIESGKWAKSTRCFNISGKREQLPGL